MLLHQLDEAVIARYDAIVVGSSFAAWPVVQALAPARRVLVIEGGDRTEHEMFRELTLNDEYGHLADGHWSSHWIRAFGGTSSRWSGVVTPLDARDLDGSSGAPAWPLAFDDLAAWYRCALEFLERPAAVGQPAQRWRDGLLFKPLSHAAPRRLATAFDRLVATPGVDLVLRETVVRLTSATRRAIDGLVVTAPTQQPRWLPLRSTQVLVLACGGLGNAQILMQPPPQGGVAIGNESGLAGRYLMEHPHVVSAHVVVNRARLPPPPDGFGNALPALMVDDELRYANDLLGCSLAIEGPVDAPDAAAEVAYFRERFGQPVDLVAMLSRSEQEPSAANALEILPERAWSGAHRLRARCSFSSRDLRTIELTTRLVGERLLMAGIGAVRLRNTAIYRETMGGGHTMGTTRMGSSRGTSVCDADQRVHGYANLFLSGSSVFPTGGAANPTLTIVALACRLGVHLRATAGRQP